MTWWHWRPRAGKWYAMAVVVLIVLNFLIFLSAYPETFVIDSGISANQPLAKDFSAYYTAAWRLLHDPTQIYIRGFLNDGEYHILPQPETYKYLPSFLMIVAPLLLLQYQVALTAFDLLQFLLLPLMAILIYKLVEEKGLATAIIAATLILLLPLPIPTPHWSISASYYWQWAEGQSKVLGTFLLLLSLYLARAERPILAGVVFGFAAFDPRFALLALPLFITYNKRLRLALLSVAGTIVIANFSFLLPGVGEGFIEMTLTSGISTPLYYYSFIPVVALVSLTIIERREVWSTTKRLLSKSSSQP